MQFLALLAAALAALAVYIIAGRIGRVAEPEPAPRSRRSGVTPRQDARDVEFAEEIAPVPAAPVEPEYAVPSRYGDNRVVLMVRDPKWVYAYWEVQPDRLRAAAEEEGADLHGSVPVLRVHDVTDDMHETIRDIPVTEYADSWYLGAMEPAHRYYVEIGRVTRQGRFIPVARSNSVTTPPSTVSAVISPEWPVGPWPGTGEPGPGSLEFQKSRGEVVEKW